MSSIVSIIRTAQIAANTTGKTAYIVARRGDIKWQFDASKRDRVIEIIKPVRV